MKFGLFYQLPCATTQDAATRYQETIEQIVYAEELGFDTAWLAELHFNPRFSIMPAPPGRSFESIRTSKCSCTSAARSTWQTRPV